jgi:hypothetical protein
LDASKLSSACKEDDDEDHAEKEEEEFDDDKDENRDANDFHVEDDAIDKVDDDVGGSGSGCCAR